MAIRRNTKISSIGKIKYVTADPGGDKIKGPLRCSLQTIKRDA